MKNILGILTVFIIFNTAAAQTRFGVKAGGNLSTFTGKPVFDVSLKPGFQVGLFAEIKASENFFVQLEFLYSDQGVKLEDEMYEDRSQLLFKETWKLSYLNIPVMAKYYPATNFFIEAGPYVGVFLNGKSKYETYIQSMVYEELTVRRTGTEDISENFKSIDFGASIGFGYDFTDHIFANARYSYGFINIYDFSGAEAVGLNKMKANNNVISLSAAYKF